MKYFNDMIEGMKTIKEFAVDKEFWKSCMKGSGKAVAQLTGGLICLCVGASVGGVAGVAVAAGGLTAGTIAYSFYEINKRRQEFKLTEETPLNGKNSTSLSKDKVSANARSVNDISSKIGDNKLEGHTLEEAKKRLRDRLVMNQSMTADINSGIAMTEKSGYGYVSEDNRRAERATKLSINDMKNAKDDLVK